MSTFRLIAQACSGIVFEYCETSLFLFYAAAISRDILPAATLIAIYVIPLIAAIARPFGAYVFGRIGDDHGAVTAIRYSATLMAVSSGLMSIVPGYDIIGNLAIVLLLLLRSIQMLSIGGEVSFAAILLIDRFRYKNLASGLIWSATSLGWLLAFLLYKFLGEDNWRQAFMCTACIGLITVPVRGASVMQWQDINDDPLSYFNAGDNDVSNAQLITFLLSASVAAFTYYSLQYSRQYVSDIYVFIAYCIALIANILAGYILDIFGGIVIIYGIALSFVVMLFIPHQQAFLIYPIVLSLWKAPTHAVVRRLFKSNICSKSGVFYALGTSAVGQGTMLVCGLLDQYYVGLSILWPILALGLALCAYTLVIYSDNDVLR